MIIDGIHLPVAVRRLPRENLGDARGSSEREQRFALRFAGVYRRQFTSIHSRSPKTETVMVLEVPVLRLGIADLVVASWSPSSRGYPASPEDLLALRPTLRAFEFKMKHWRRGLMQAHRYAHFADTAVLVLPLDRLRCARRYLPTFTALRVGLWGFDESAETVTQVYTPRPHRNGKLPRWDAVVRAVAENAFVTALPTP